MNDADWLHGLFKRSWAPTLPWRTVYNEDGELIAIGTNVGTRFEVEGDPDACELAVAAVNQLPAVFAALGAAVCPVCHTKGGANKEGGCDGVFHAVVSLYERRGRPEQEPAGFEAWMDEAHPNWRDPRLSDEGGRAYIAGLRAAYAAGRDSRAQEVRDLAAERWLTIDAARLSEGLERLLAGDRANLRPGLDPTLEELLRLALELREDAADQAWAHVRALEAEGARERREWADRLADMAPPGEVRVTVQGAALRTGNHTVYIVGPDVVRSAAQPARAVTLEEFAPLGSSLRRQLDVALEDAAAHAEATAGAGAAAL